VAALFSFQLTIITYSQGSIPYHPEKMDQKTLHSLLDYDPTTGLLTWRVNRRQVKAGTVAGWVNGNGYLQITVQGKHYLVHQLVWFYTTGVWPSEVVDHVDGNKLNNSWKNLREATYRQNNWNRRGNSGKLKGVTRNKRTGKWRVQIHIDGKKKELGEYPPP